MARAGHGSIDTALTVKTDLQNRDEYRRDADAHVAAPFRAAGLLVCRPHRERRLQNLHPRPRLTRLRMCRTSIRPPGRPLACTACTRPCHTSRSSRTSPHHVCTRLRTHGSAPRARTRHTGKKISKTKYRGTQRLACKLTKDQDTNVVHTTQK